MIDDLLAAGLSTLAGTSIQSYEKLAKDLGSYYLTGPQLAFSRLALTVKAIQRDPANAARGYAEASRILVTLSSTIKKARAFLEARLEQGQFTAEDTILYEALAASGWARDFPPVGAEPETVPPPRILPSGWEKMGISTDIANPLPTASSLRKSRKKRCFS